MNHLATAIAATWSNSLHHLAMIPLLICPVAPPGAQAQVDKIGGYVVWGVFSLFILGGVVAIGSIVAGKIFSMPHASKGGIVGLVIILIAAVLYVVMPGMVTGIIGTGCVG
jgi:hypothetical protein